MSQFKAQIHAVLDLPIPATLTPRVRTAIMLNILGGATPTSHHRLTRLARSTYDEDMDVYLHLYGKESKPGRKIGHITLTGFSSIEELEEKARPFIELVDEIRQERIDTAAEQLRRQEELPQDGELSPSVLADDKQPPGETPQDGELSPPVLADVEQPPKGAPQNGERSPPVSADIKQPPAPSIISSGERSPPVVVDVKRPPAPATKSSESGAIQTNGDTAPEVPLVLVTMGSDSDLPVLKAGLDILKEFKVPYALDITSAHRTPRYMMRVAEEAAGRGIKVIIAAAGGAAHLPGMLSSETPLPVIGVPVKATHMDGLDSLLSIVQMPVRIPSLSSHYVVPIPF